MTVARFEVLVLDGAFAEVVAAGELWEANRTKAPNLLVDEVGRALDLLATSPTLGMLAPGIPRRRGIRRMLLPRVGYHLYFSIEREAHRVVVLSFWHAHRLPPNL
jgi:hypothetical protein